MSLVIGTKGYYNSFFDPPLSWVIGTKILWNSFFDPFKTRYLLRFYILGLISHEHNGTNYIYVSINI